MKILHVFRAPVGGLFRHVRDLVIGQKQLGHDVGIVCDSSTGGAVADGLLTSIVPHCSLGIHRIEILRLPGFGDVSAVLKTKAIAKLTGAEIVHGHGAKGGLYGRLAARILGIPAVYTPHGGSLHYKWLGFPGALFLASERLLAQIGSGLIFVCEFERQSFAKKIGLGNTPNVVVYNGLWPTEFNKIVPNDNASDVFFIGDMRELKGVDILLKALKAIKRKRMITANFVGDGPDLVKFQGMASTLGIDENVRFLGRLPTAEALKCGRLLIMPSRAESFPYVILEAAAGQVPLIASDIGGIPEILSAESLCPPDSAEALARHIELSLATPKAVVCTTQKLFDDVKSRFSASEMARNISEFYHKLRID